jgi:hypothetical protein
LFEQLAPPVSVAKEIRGIMRGFILALAIAVAAVSGSAFARELKEFPTEEKAQKHCPKDTVVWSEFRGGGYFHAKGSPRYGKGEDGGYLCRKEAEAEGWKEFVKPQK